MNVIKMIPYWEDSYQLFLLCEQLNTNGVTGWYLPAINELASLDIESYWSSTENSDTAAYRWTGSGRYSRTATKRNKFGVVAVHKF